MNDVQPLLHYGLRTDPDPPQASPKSGNARPLALTFVVTPPDQGAVYCDWISFHFSIGPKDKQDATYLTTVGDGIATVPPNPPGQPAGDWKLDTAESSPGDYSFLNTTKDLKVGRLGNTFVVRNIVVSPLVGTARLTVTENSSNSAAATTFTRRTAVFEIPKFPPTFGSVTFQTDATSVEPGAGTTLRWQGDDSAVYSLSRNGTPVKGQVTSPWQTGALNEDTVFTLTVSYDAQGTKVERDYYVTVLVRNPVVTLSGPKDPVRSGDPITLKWHTESVHGCFINGPGAAHKRIDGLTSLVVRPGGSGKFEYRLQGTTASGDAIDDEFTVQVLPKAPATKGQLVLVKTSGNKDGHVSIRVADGAGRFQTALPDFATGWAEADVAGASMLVVPYQLGKNLPDLVQIKSDRTDKSTTPGVWHVHACFSPQHGQGDDLNLRTPFTDLFAAHGTWFMAPMGETAPGPNPPPDLVFVQTADTGPAKCVQVFHSAYLRAYPSVVGPWLTPFPESVAAKGTWLLGCIDAKPGVPLPDLVFVQTSGTASGRVEVSYATGSSRYRQLATTTPDGIKTPVVTGFATSEARHGTWHLADMTGDGKQDLVFVKTANTPSNRVVLRYAEAAQGYKHPVGGFTLFDTSEGPTGTWIVLGADSPAFVPVEVKKPERPVRPLGPHGAEW